MGFFLSTKRSRRKQKTVFLITAIFLAAGLVASSMAGIFSGSSHDDQARAVTEPEQTIAELEKQVQENPQDVILLGKLARAYKDNGQVEKAEETYLKALQVDPGSSLRTELAFMYFLQGKNQQAVAQMEEELERHPDNLTARYYLGQFLAYGLEEYTRAVEELRAFVDAAGKVEGMEVDVQKARQMIKEFEEQAQEAGAQ